jgi:transposase
MRKIHMRGKAERQRGVVYFVDVETQLRDDHPLREVKRLCKEVLKALEPDFERMYAVKGRPSIPPERLLMAWVLTD